MHSSASRFAIVLFAVSCAKAQGEVPRDKVAPAESAPPNIGERVVVESATATFVEGIVSALDREQVKVALRPSGKLIEQPVSAIYVPSRRAREAALPRGSFAVCRLAAGLWPGSRLDAVAI